LAWKRNKPTPPTDIPVWVSPMRQPLDRPASAERWSHWLVRRTLEPLAGEKTLQRSCTLHRAAVCGACGVGTCCFTSGKVVGSHVSIQQGYGPDVTREVSGFGCFGCFASPPQGLQLSIQEKLFCRNAQWFRGGLVFKGHSLWYHSSLASRVRQEKRRRPPWQDRPALSQHTSRKK